MTWIRCCYHCQGHLIWHMIILFYHWKLIEMHIWQDYFDTIMKCEQVCVSFLLWVFLTCNQCFITTCSTFLLDTENVVVLFVWYLCFWGIKLCFIVGIYVTLSQSWHNIEKIIWWVYSSFCMCDHCHVLSLDVQFRMLHCTWPNNMMLCLWLLKSRYHSFVDLNFLNF